VSPLVRQPQISFVISFAERVERGTGKALLRLGKHFLSLSPIFEVFSTQIYINSILSNLTFGGARYLATGRGFATTRISFSILYSRFAGPSIYMGMRNLLVLLYATMAIWIPHLIYISKTAMSFFSLFSPFAFLMMKIRQKKGTGFLPFSAFFQKAEKDTKVSFFFLISL
jgi:hypothetical protein